MFSIMGPDYSGRGGGCKRWLRARDLAYNMGIMSEIVFLVEDAPEGGFIARALGESIFTEADTLEELRSAVRDAVACHFDIADAPKVIRLHFVRDEVIPA
jgi:hypothetical protein